MEHRSALAGLDLVLDDLADRFPELDTAVVRQQALEVLCLAAPERITPTLVVRLVEARLLALL